MLSNAGPQFKRIVDAGVRSRLFASKHEVLLSQVMVLLATSHDIWQVGKKSDNVINLIAAEYSQAVIMQWRGEIPIRTI
ncbi:MAG: hypothetical protein JWN23_358 [Rhodocyclales bacterium]|nr:hypothetical protein [Rhodocyclales bacterium]